jgi:alanine-synthesizing transaminase
MFSSRTNWKLSPNTLTKALEALRSTGAPILDLTNSNPTQCGFEYDSAAIVDAFRQPQMLDYDPQPKGLLSARLAVAEYYSLDHKASVHPESICLTTSTSEAYTYVFRLLCNPGDEILVPTPSYPLFEFLADLQDVKLVPYSLQYAHSWFIDFQSLERALTPRTRAILLVHPNNPTGSYLRREEVQRLSQTCRERELALIVDEVFLDYSLGEQRAFTLASNQDCLTFTLSGLSKISALPQMKVAWIAVGGPHSQVEAAMQRLEVIADTYLSLNAPTLLAFPSLLNQRSSINQQIRTRVLHNRAALQTPLSQQNRLSLLDAEGGWYAVVKLPADALDEATAIRLLQEQHVLVHPGHFYNFSTDNFLVLSLITPASSFRDGVFRLSQWVVL